MSAIPATLVASNDHGVAFRDLNPQAPSHVLVIPRRHVASLVEATDAAELGALLLLAAEVARSLAFRFPVIGLGIVRPDRAFRALYLF